MYLYKYDQSFIYETFASASVGVTELTYRNVDEPYLNIDLVIDPTYNLVQINTERVTLDGYIKIIASVGGLWASVQAGAFILVYINSNKEFLLKIVNKLYLTKREKMKETANTD